MVFFQPHLRDCINAGSVRKPNLPQRMNYCWFYYSVHAGLQINVGGNCDFIPDFHTYVPMTLVLDLRKIQS